MKKIFYAILLSAIMLCGCGGQSNFEAVGTNTESSVNAEENNTASESSAAESSSESEENMLMPDSAVRALSEADIEGKDDFTIRLIKNEILARHGFVFSSDEVMRNYFSNMSWYTPDPDFTQSQLTGVELENFTFLQNYLNELDAQEEAAEETTQAAAQTAQAPPAPPAAPPAYTTQTTLYCSASDYATLRTAPSRSAGAICTLGYNTAVSLLGTSGEFYYVNYNGTNGYVLAEFFSYTPYPTKNYGSGSSYSETTTSSDIYYCNASDYATLRSAASRNASALARITYNQQVTRLGGSGEFSYVSYNGTKGYVLTKFLSKDYYPEKNYDEY